MHSTRIQRQGSASLEMPRQPLLASGMPAALGRQQRTQLLTGLEPRQHLLDTPTDNHRIGTGTRRQTCRAQLGLHAATPQRAASPARYRIQRRVVGTRLADQIGIGIAARIGVEHAVTVGQDHQQIGLDQVGDQRRQRVVVAEADLVGDDGVVLVDHRHDIQIEQCPQGAAGVEIALAIGQVVMGDENLRRLLIATSEAGFPGTDEPHLANRGGRLQLVDRPRASRPTQTTHTGRHRTGRNQHQLDACRPQRHHLIDPDGHRRLIEPPAVRSQQRTADLHHPAPSAAHLVPHRSRLLP